MTFFPFFNSIKICKTLWWYPMNPNDSQFAEGFQWWSQDFLAITGQPDSQPGDCSLHCASKSQSTGLEGEDTLCIGRLPFGGFVFHSGPSHLSQAELGQGNHMASTTDCSQPPAGLPGNRVSGIDQITFWWPLVRHKQIEWNQHWRALRKD